MMPQDEMREGYRLSLQQARLAALAAGDGYRPAPLTARIRIDGPVDRQRLRDAVGAVLACHESFRTRIEQLPGMVTPVQVIEPPEGVSGLLAELSGPVDAQVWAAPVSNGGPPLRLGLHALGADRHEVLVAAAREIADPASLFVFASDLARACGGENLSPEDVLQYADYAEWQRELLEAGDEGAARYWRQPGLSDLLLRPVPLASPSRNEPRVEWAVRKLVVPEIDKLAPLSRHYSVTPADVLLAAWCAWLGRLGGLPEVLVGLTGDARNEELEDTCGAYQRVLPLRLAIPAAASFGELVRAVHAARTEAEDHGDYFTWALTDAAPSVTGPQPVCPFGFGYVRAAGGAQSVAGRQPRVALALPLPLEPHALYLGVLEGPDCLQLVFHSDSTGISPEAAECLCEQFGTLLSGALRGPELPVAALPLLAPSERARVLAVDPELVLDAAVDGGLHGLFERAAQTTPTAAALFHDGVAWTYAELNALANRLARRLRALGATRESRIGVAAAGPVDMITGALAVLKAGGVYVPMDPKHPGERLAALARDAGLEWLLGDPDLAGRLGEAPCRVLCLAEEFPQLDRYAADMLAEPVEPEQAAYLIYTSGSTGQPKGVAVTHRNAVQSTRARLAYYPRAAGSFLLLSAFTFDSSIAGIFGTLAAGGCIVLPRDEAVQDLESLEQLMTVSRVSQLLCVPSLYAVLLEQLGAGVLEALDTVIVAGEACPTPLVRRHHARLPRTELVNEYGPTEATVWCTAYRTRPDNDLAPVSIGRGVAHVRIYVLDERLEPVPRGVAGELYVGGAGVARGYWRRPGLTAAAFVPDPFGTPGARMYRTGDRARYEIDGRVTFLGRQDHQLKIRGFRIEPGEIESVLCEYPAVRSAVVTAYVEKSGEARLAAYLTLAMPDSTLDGLQAFAARRLPDYMVPVAWTVLPRLPLTPNGKIDRQALPEPTAPASQHYVAPRNPAERVLAGIWCELLRVERVGVEDNFFALGGDSILSIQMVSRARQQGLAITARQVFATPTIAALAASEPAASNAEACSPHRGPVPLTPIQRWFFALDYPSPNRWTHAVLLRLLQPVDDAVLAAAAEAVVRHHDALRMQYRRVGSGWEQSVRSE
ncbi:MAG: amino acid adenylation domain-containing protein, partial [Gammaproteobacteria bacterium]|nr:amino acid adenylation domain-containing protein [Gammaproteobacteria bacterium]